MPKTGAPKGNTNRRREDEPSFSRLNIRVTAEEHARLQALASASGKTMSDYIREKALADDQATPRP